MVNQLPSIEMKKLMETQPGIVLDVRTKMEVEEAHLEMSIHIDIQSPTFQDEIQKLDKEKIYYVYCRSGNRSYHAANFMIQNGFKTIYNMSDGIIGWSRLQLPLVMGNK